MKSVVFKFKNDDLMITPGDRIDTRDEFIIAWSGEDIVAMVRRDEVVTVCIYEKREAENDQRKAD